MTDLEKSVPGETIEAAVEDLQDLVERSPVLSVAAVHVLKNDLGDIEEVAPHRRLLASRRFVLPGDGKGFANLGGWLRGDDREAFRDRCDAAFWSEVVPYLEERFGDVAEPLMNTVNEAVINYAEYSFRRWSLGRRVVAQVFLTEDDLGYAIVRPLGTRLRVFDPLSLKEKSAQTLEESKRGWGHTILMRRALFISFDKSPDRRGLMIVAGPDSK